jgi:hypothetical protein
MLILDGRSESNTEINGFQDDFPQLRVYSQLKFGVRAKQNAPANANAAYD